VVTPAHREKFIAGVSLRPNANGLSQPDAKARIVEETRSLWNSSVPSGPSELVAMMARLNHDQADALGLATMAALHLGWPTLWRRLRRHLENVALVDWPQAVTM
jgi:hypothetical protein